jgi:Uma2 family endonuclease
MSAAPSFPFVSVEQYIVLSVQSNIRLEYDRGLAYAMAGASEDHIIITSNINTTLNIQTKGRPCFVYGSDMRIGLPSAPSYFYPDVTVACGERTFEKRPDGDTLLNPLVVVEVLSASTESHDKTRKREVYHQISSVTDYLLVRQDRVSIMHEQRSDGWIPHEYTDLSDTLLLTSIGCTLLLSDVYDKVTWG